jgi:hypothetical protein
MNRLAGLDSRVFPSLRRPGEAAEDYLRRVAARRWGINVRESFEVQRALREHFARLDQERG